MNDADDAIDSYLGAVKIAWDPYIDPLFSRMIASAILGDYRHTPERKPEPETATPNEIVTFDLVPLTDEELVKARGEGRVTPLAD